LLTQIIQEFFRKIHARDGFALQAERQENLPVAAAEIKYFRVFIGLKEFFIVTNGVFPVQRTYRFTVDSSANIYFNLNQFYMAGIMTIPMILTELFLMRSMYKNKKLNKLIIFISLAAFGILFALLRNQLAIGNKEFLKSMIPHHAGALLMCQKAKLTDPELKQLCTNIINSQQSEINFMKSKLAALDSPTN